MCYYVIESLFHLWSNLCFIASVLTSQMSVCYCATVWARILNLWNSRASCLYYTNFSFPFPYMFITMLPFRIKHLHARSCITRWSAPCLPHLASSIPIQLHIHFSRSLILPVPITRYYMFTVYPKPPDLFLWYITISWFDTVQSLIFTLHTLTYKIQQMK